MSPEQAQTFLSMVMGIPRPWMVAMILLAIVSSIDLRRPASGGYSLHFGVGTAALVAIALLWLPPVLRLLSLTGGGLKAFGLEASAGGLRNAPDALIVGLARIRTEVSEVERVTPNAAQLTESVRVEVDRIASAYLDGTASVTTDALDALARRYEHVRATTSPSPARAVSMNQILNEARVRARAAPDVAARAGLRLLSSPADGDRVIGLALLQQQPNPDALPGTLRLVQTAKSAFEQYHALVAIKAMAPLLSSEQRTEAAETLKREQADPRGVGLMQDRYLPGAFESSLAELGADTG